MNYKYCVAFKLSQKKDNSSVNKNLKANKSSEQTSNITDINSVLIYAKNEEQLSDTYPNYLYNIEKFIEKVEELIKLWIIIMNSYSPVRYLRSQTYSLCMLRWHSAYFQKDYIQ